MYHKLMKEAPVYGYQLKNFQQQQQQLQQQQQMQQHPQAQYPGMPPQVSEWLLVGAWERRGVLGVQNGVEGAMCRKLMKQAPVYGYQLKNFQQQQMQQHPQAQYPGMPPQVSEWLLVGAWEGRGLRVGVAFIIK